MNYDYDILVIGLGPAGMAVSLMGSAMGLKVCAIEKEHVGGECMNVGCIPSKALLRMGKSRAAFDKLAAMELAATPKPAVLQPFRRIAESLRFIAEKKTMGMFSQVEMIYQQGAAAFVDARTVEIIPKTVGNSSLENLAAQRGGDMVEGEASYPTRFGYAGKKITAKRIFICTGTRPEMPPIEGLAEIDPLTNESMFHLSEVPKRLVVLGSGAIACEMAQAFARLGSDVTMIFRGPRLLWREDEESSLLLEAQLEKDGVKLRRDTKPIRFTKTGETTRVECDKGEVIECDRVLVALGRRFDFSSLKLENARVKFSERGITVDKYLRTTTKHIFACGDCNGHALFSHAAMHQGMLALMNCMMPHPLKYRFDKYVVPWTVFTEPQISRVGKSARELDEAKIKYETVSVKYGDYGAAIAEAIDTGHVKVHVSPLTGRIYGATIVGEGSGEMINEWGLAIQHRFWMYQIMMQQHSFPTMGFLSKRVAETWMMRKMESSWLKWMCRKMFGF